MVVEDRNGWRIEHKGPGGTDLVLEEDGQVRWEAQVRPNGCVDLKHFYSAPRTHPGQEADFSEIHLCDLDMLPRLLFELRELLFSEAQKAMREEKAKERT